MNLIQVTQESITIGRPLPFALRDETGILLARKGFVIDSREDLEAIRGRGSGFYIDVSESEKHQKAYVGKLYDLVRDERPLGKIAQARLTTRDLDIGRTGTSDDLPRWLDIQDQADRLLRDLQAASFLDDLERLSARLQRERTRNPDGALLALVQLTSREVQLYSATHAMLVSLVCALAAREVLGWPEDQVARLSKAALTMNIGMTVLQDRLAAQIEPPVPEQRQQIANHPARAVELLEGLGVDDAEWLEAVRDHHATGPGPLAPRSPGQRLARLIQRADLFVARMAPRAARRALSNAAASHACYFDESRAIDEAGAALIKAVGVYAPGSLVRLANQEIGVVVRRGANSRSPRVAVLVNRDGFATAEYLMRDSSQRELRVIASLAPHECKVQVHLERVLPMTAGGASGRGL